MEIIKYLGIDWGEKRIGSALGDGLTKIATPFKVLNSFDEVRKVIENETIDVVVLGVPFSKIETRQPASEDYNLFADKLKGLGKIKVEYIDERLSSKAADALSRDKKAKAQRDNISAMLILQTFFDKQRA
jgi:putative holliday junction resolvase